MQCVSEAEGQKWHYDSKTNGVSLEPGDTNTSRGRRKVKDQWKEEPYKVEHQVVEGISSYIVKNWWTGHSQVLH